jgi:hypothetical protein
MKMSTKDRLLARFASIFPSYRFQWTGCMGDSSGRENAIDIFGVPPQEQLNFLRDSRNLRKDFEDELKGRPLFIFRSA